MCETYKSCETCESCEMNAVMTKTINVGIIMSGGASSRMGKPKALLTLSGHETFLATIARVMREGGCQVVMCVVGCHAAEIAPHLPDGVMMVLNKNWNKGQLESVRLGLKNALLMNPDHIVVHVVDQPLITAEDVKSLLEVEFSTDGIGLAIACHQGERGHPIAMGPKTAAAVVNDNSAKTLRQALAHAVPQPRLVEGGSVGCLRGANTPEELKNFMSDLC